MFKEGFCTCCVTIVNFSAMGGITHCHLSLSHLLMRLSLWPVMGLSLKSIQRNYNWSITHAHISYGCALWHLCNALSPSKTYIVYIVGCMLNVFLQRTLACSIRLVELALYAVIFREAYFFSDCLLLWNSIPSPRISEQLPLFRKFMKTWLFH